MDSIGTFGELGGIGLVCPDSVPTVLGLLDPSIAPPFLYYSYLPIIVVALLFGTFVLIVSREALAGRLLLWIAIVFSLITLSELFLWIATPAALVHFVWQSVIVLHAVLAFLLVHFTYVFVNGRNMPSRWQWILLVPLVPIFVLAPTGWNLSAFDLINCESIQGALRPYLYAVETAALAAAFFICAKKSHQTRDRKEYRKAVTLGVGIVFFFGLYILSNIFGDVTLIYDINLVGPIGMVAFLATIAYLIVKYHAFNMRVLSAQALMGALIALIFAALFVETIATVRYVLLGTLVFVIILGILLIRSVKREVEQREHIEKLAGELQETNKRQEGLLHFIGHEVKGFLTKDAGAFASLIDGDFGVLPEPLKPFVTRALAQSRDGARSVTDILTASNQKKGTMTYAKESFDLKALIEEVMTKERPMADERSLALLFTADDSSAPYTFAGDRDKIGDNVLRNLFENAIHYTPSGTISASLKKEAGRFVFTVEDTGIGISDEDKTRLFTEGGHGKDSQRMNVHSTGYGLFIAKNIVVAHGGTIRAESDGPGKGSRFIVEFSAS